MWMGDGLHWLCTISDWMAVSMTDSVLEEMGMWVKYCCLRGFTR